MPARTKDHYRTLGVPESAGPGEIKKAYLRLAKKCHPDANPDDPRAADKFKRVSEAYTVLSDKKKRAQYDTVRKYGGLGGLGGRGGPRPGGAGRGGAGPGAGNGGFGGLGDIFSSIFDFGRKEKPGPSHIRGRNVEYLVEIPFKTAARGGKVVVNIPLHEECAQCHGNGATPGTGMKSCQECRGEGNITFGQGSFGVSRPCPDCVGRGKIPESPCAACNGGGQVRQERKLRVTVPSGVTEGDRVRLAGKGERGSGGKPPGDIIIKFSVRGDRFFKRDGLDLHCDVKVNMAQAVVGSKIRVRTVDGSKVVLRIPPGTQTGRRFRIKGAGVARGGGRGDQVVRVAVETPELSAEAREKIGDILQEEGLRR